jgi:type IV pilus assembly protein PilM
VPFDIEGVQLDFQVLDPEGEGVQMDVLLVAAKRELVENRAALLTDAGLDPAVVDVDAFALHNAFEVNYPEAMHGVAAMIHVGHEVTNVNILQDGVPLLTRDLSVGTRKFREDLQRERGMSADDADRLLQGFERSPDLDPFVKARGEEIGGGVGGGGGLPGLGIPGRGPDSADLLLRRWRAHSRPREHAGRAAPPAGGSGGPHQRSFREG